MPRTAILVLVDPTGVPLGALPPIELPAPWWQDVADMVAAAHARHGLAVTVLRVLAADRAAPPGGTVTYLAQVAEAPPALLPVPAGIELGPQPGRAAWAEPGGPDRTLAWAADLLGRLGRGAYRPVQQRTWNLSAIWRLDPIDSAGGPVWVKQVPDFFAHEAAVLSWLGRAVPGAAPVLLGADGSGRILLDHVPGTDRYGAEPDERDAIGADHHRIQLRAVADLDALLAAGVPDRRGPVLAAGVREVLAGHGADLAPVAGLLAGLDDRLAEVGACGLPDTLVHGDLHPGNVRSTATGAPPPAGGAGRVIIDWGDAFVGHPAFDVIRLTEGLEPAVAAALTGSWAARWRAAVPGCAPERALELVRPVAWLRMAAVYADFLARIEAAEHPYHRQDVPDYLARAAAAGRIGLPRKRSGNASH